VVAAGQGTSEVTRHRHTHIWVCTSIAGAVSRAEGRAERARRGLAAGRGRAWDRDRDRRLGARVLHMLVR
jgi:hypothetical protein